MERARLLLPLLLVTIVFSTLISVLSLWFCDRSVVVCWLCGVSGVVIVGQGMVWRMVRGGLWHSISYYRSVIGLLVAGITVTGCLVIWVGRLVW